MLAAYNGGPGNTLYWQELAGEDMDLFLETIRIQETRNYIRLIHRELHRLSHDLWHNGGKIDSGQ